MELQFNKTIRHYGKGDIIDIPFCENDTNNPLDCNYSYDSENALTIQHRITNPEHITQAKAVWVGRGKGISRWLTIPDDISPVLDSEPCDITFTL